MQTENESIQQKVSLIISQAQQAIAAGDQQTALLLLDQVLSQHPDHPDANYQSALVDLQIKGSEAALKKFEKAVTNKPQSEKHWIGYIETLMETASLEIVLEALELGQEYSLSAKRAQDLASKYLANRQDENNFDASLQSKHDAEEIEPEDSDDKTILDDQQSDSVNYKSQETFSIDALFQNALTAHENEDYDEAIKGYLSVLAINPNHADANHNIGIIETITKDALTALPRFEAAVQSNPKSEQFWVSYIDALMMSGATQTAADAIEAGQKYGLTHETAQTLAAEVVNLLESKAQPSMSNTLAISPDRDAFNKALADVVIAHSVADNIAESELHETPFLSLCIPTFNRGNLLKRTLESITSQDIFINTNHIEIVIADNCSTDETQSVAEAFAAAYPQKIKYIRNSENIGASLNFELVLSKGTGQFLKLLNDNLFIRDGSLEELVKIIKATSHEKPILFLTNGAKKYETPIGVANNLNDFVENVSYFSTWIGCFGIWRDEFNKISDFSASAHLLLIQTDILFKLLALGRRALLVCEQYFIVMDVGKKGGYNIAEVFGNNYLSILKEYCANGSLDSEVYETEKKEVLLKHIIPFYFDQDNDFHKNGFFPHMHDYVNDEYFYQAIEGLIASKPSAKPEQMTYEQKIAANWRSINPHNETKLELVGVANLDKIKVGRRSYGKLHVHGFANPEESLTIGSFVSIADEVTFLLGGNHPYLGFSTFPFKAKYFSTTEATTKGSIEVGDDVWIGYKSTILSGVKIGQGAVIAAGSIVTRDVEPYSIVGGNPAKLIKYRFDKEIIDKLIDFDFSKLSNEKVLGNKEILYEELTSENVDAILSRLN